MEITVIQIFALLFAGFAFSRAFLRFKDKKITSKEFFFWTLIWGAVIIVALLPGLTYYLSRIVGVGRGVDFAMYISIIILFYLVFRLYVKIDTVEQNLSKIVQEITIKKKK